MKLVNKYFIIALTMVGLATSMADAQVVRKRGNERNNDKQAGAQVTDRMQSFYEEEPKSEADLMWMRVIYRQLDATTENNAPLFFPEEKTEDQENLFRIIMRLLTSNQLKAYEYLDGREIFTDEYRKNTE